MKKIFAIIMTICLIASMLYVTAFAADVNVTDEPAEGVVLRVSGLKTDGITEVIEDYNNFEEGWNEAVLLARQLELNGYDRIIVDFYADWNANSRGEFGKSDGLGFDFDTIYIPDEARITLNLKNHTINRGLTEWEWNGEVICIDDDADVIINDGTITGGWSNNGAGGIHVKGDVNLTLNNVNIVGNTADDDDGGGIALYSGSTLTMNGGSFKDNRIIGSRNGVCGGAVYIEDSNAVFNNVEFKNNITGRDNSYGAAIYAEDGDVTLNGCTFEGNGLDPNKSTYYSSIIYVYDSAFAVNNCTFKNNRADAMFLLRGANLSVTTSEFSGINDTVSLFKSNKPASIYISDTNFENNKSYVVFTSGNINEDSFFRNCKFNNTKSSSGVTFSNTYSPIEFYDCDFGDCSLNGNVKVVNSTVTKEEAVIGVSGIRADGTTSFTNYYKNLANAWKLAMETAASNNYDRIIVDLYVDWNSNEMGALEIPEYAKVTLNMNGHTIDRKFIGGFNGEVVCVNECADVIINDGTVMGGFSANGAGGIHIKDNASVVLNNVTVRGNHSKGSVGAGIAVMSGSVLVMNGGSISENSMIIDDYKVFIRYPYGVLYADNATVSLNDVTISNNQAKTKDAEGVAIYAEDSTVTLNSCVISGNMSLEYAESVIGAVDSKLIINNTDFTNNGAVSGTMDVDYSHLFYLEDSSLTMEGGKITANNADKLFRFEDSDADIKGVAVTDNKSVVLDVDNSSKKVTLTECTLGNNSPVKELENIIIDTSGTLVLIDCTLGDTAFNDINRADIVDSTRAKRFGSIFGEGSVVMIVSLLAIITSGVAIFLVVYYNKKQAVPVAANNATETEDEE